MIIHLIGLGGAGKTTTGKLLGKKLDISCFDLDEYFLEHVGDISTYINNFGYEAYAAENLQSYLHLKVQIPENESAIIVCSSGFMTYPKNIATEYFELRQKIENDPFTFLLIPSLDLEQCVKIIVERQLKRTYLNPTTEKEEMKVRRRFEIYNNLNSRKILTNQLVDDVVIEIAHCLQLAIK